MATATAATYLTADEVAGLCRISVSTVKRWAAQGKLPQPLRPGKRMLFAADAVHEHLARLRAADR